MFIKVVEKKDLSRFINFPDSLYKGDSKYTPFIKSSLKKDLNKLLFVDKTYKALIALDDDNNIVARVAFTIDKNKQFSTDKCGFYYFYECVDDFKVSHAIFAKMEEMLREMGALYISGTYYPFDPDNRRGIMIKGFEKAPLIFTSYNKPYYAAQMEEYGFIKNVDTYEYSVDITDELYDRMKKLADAGSHFFDYRVDVVDFNNVERDIQDIVTIMNEATTEINYQEAPSYDELKNIFNNWKTFLNKNYILICRDNKTNEPIGFAMAIPDYFELFRKIKGNLNIFTIFKLLFYKNKIKSLRGMLQYVRPQYQKTSAIPLLYHHVFNQVRKDKIEYVELGTIVETNEQSKKVCEAAKGQLTRIYRLFYKKLEN